MDGGHLRSLSDDSGVPQSGGLAIYRTGPLLGCDVPFNRNQPPRGTGRNQGRAHHPMPSTSLEQLDAFPVGMVLHAFTNQELIGHGGCGIVCRTEHNELDLSGAIKEYLQSELAVREGVTVQPLSGTDRTNFEDGLRRFRDDG